MTDTDDEQRMFKIDIQVGDIRWTPHIQDQLGDKGSVCANFQFLDYPPAEICQDSFCTDCTHKDVGFKTGKMIMFALKKSDLVRYHNKFFINIRADLMTLKAGRFPFRTELAKARVNLSNDFTAILSACFQPHVQHPGSKFINDEIDLVNQLGQAIGVMNLFLRLSTFGGTLMGHLYPDTNASDFLQTGQDVGAQAWVNQAKVATCPKRYVQMLGADHVIEYKEYRGTGADHNMIVARLYKLNPKIDAKSPNSPDCQQSGSYTLEPGTLLLRGGQVQQEPVPGFVQPANETTVHYRMTTKEEDVSEKVMVQYIPTPTGKPPTSVGPITMLPPDEKTDLYVLRIGKKKPGCELKTHLEIELRTPKYEYRQKERFHEGTQYDKQDFAPPTPL